MIDLIDKLALAAVFFATGYVACTCVMYSKATAIAKRYTEWIKRKK